MESYYVIECSVIGAVIGIIIASFFKMRYEKRKIIATFLKTRYEKRKRD